MRRMKPGNLLSCPSMYTWRGKKVFPSILAENILKKKKKGWYSAFQPRPPSSLLFLIQDKSSKANKTQ